ncbi:MAG: pilus assembly protein [Alphaproteobacteria bacterium]|nr:pilus assembly protein [Alphaproteobacteria bacterium]
MPGWLKRLRGRFTRDEGGAAALEYAMVAPVFILALVGMMELGLMTFANVLLEGGLREASRYGATGFALPDGTSRADRIRQIVIENGAGLVVDEHVTITALIYPSFESIGQAEPFQDANDNDSYDEGETYTDVNGNGQWDPDMGLEGAGGAGDIVVYRVDYPWSPITNLFGGMIGDINLSTSLVIRNEPFDS